MKKKEWNEGLNYIDPDLVEKYVEQKDRLRQKKERSGGVWLRAGAVAACLLLLLGAVIAVPMLREDGGGVIISPDNATDDDVPSSAGDTEITDIDPPSPPDKIIFDATVCPEKLNGSSLEFVVGSSISISGGSADPAPPAFQFSYGIAVKARVVKNHPDKYYKLNVGSVSRPSAYRLIQMETIEVISGENVPQYFLYLIPEYVYVDMSVYDSLIISMTQLGVENYVLKNETKNQMESFELPIFADEQDLPELGNIIAFTDGVFDESLWQNGSWLYGYQFGKHYLDDPDNSYLVVARGDDESTVITAIKAQYGEWYNAPVLTVRSLDPATKAAKDALEYVKPFANGVFSQYYSGTEIIYRRYINGCQTEETISIDLLTEEVTYSEIRYTKEDMERIENISAHLSNKASEYEEQLPTPPHTDPEGKELLCLNLYAWYVKVDGKLYGVIKTSWRYMEKDDWFIQYYDDSYVLYDMTAGSATDISRDDLIAIVGTRNVYTGEYGKGILMPM